MSQGLILFYLIGTVSVLGVGTLTWRTFSRGGIKVPIIVPCGLIAASGYMVIAHYLKLSTLHAYVDFAHWAQVLHSIVETGKPLSLNQDFYMPGTLNYLSIHFVPLIYVFAFPFALFPSNETIVGLNYLLMLSSVVPLYKLAVIRDGRKVFGLCVAALLTWHPTFQYIVMYEFEMMRFSIPIILWMLYFWERRAMIGYYSCVIMVVLVREQLGLTVAMFGFYVLVAEKKIKHGFTTLLVGVASFLLITQVIMPSFSASSAVEVPAVGLIKEVLENPIGHLLTIGNPVKLGNVFLLFLPLLCVPFGAPIALMGALANLGGAMISTTLTHSSYMLYYVSPSMPFIFYALIKAWPRVTSTFRKMGVSTSRCSSDDPMMVAMLAGMLAANVFFGPSFLSLQFWSDSLRPAPFRTQSFHRSVYRITEHHRTAFRLSELIPASAIISAPQFLHPVLAAKRGAMVFPRLEAPNGGLKSEYVVFDKTNNGLGSVSPAFITQEEFDIVEKDPESWELVKAEDDYYLYRRRGSAI